MSGILFQRVEVLAWVPLLPSQLDNLSEGLYQHLNSYVGKYIKALKGVVLCYSDELHMVNESGAVVDADPQVYFNIKVEFIVVKILIGKHARGRLEDRTEGEVWLSTFGILPVRIKTSEKVAEGSHRYKIEDIDIKKMQITGSFV